MPPAASYQQRPTAPSPRVAAPKMTENIYAGAGSASQNIPTPAPREEQVQVPTPQMEFERRLAENPIVPAGAFGGSAPTAHFFSPKSSPGAPASLSTGTPAAPASFGSTSGGGRDNYRTQQSYTPEDEDSQSKWQRLDDNEKKRVAAEAYKAFEKSLEDRRGTALKPKAGSMGRGGAGRTGGGSGALKGGSGGAGAARTVAVSKQVEPRRKRQTAAAKKETGALPPEKKAQQQQSASAPKQSAQQIRAAAAQASAKRMVRKKLLRWLCSFSLRFLIFIHGAFLKCSLWQRWQVRMHWIYPFPASLLLADRLFYGVLFSIHCYFFLSTNTQQKLNKIGRRRNSV